MMARGKQVFTMAPSQPFLEVLAKAVLDGFPGGHAGQPSPLDLARCTILLPTRRAAREMERIFFRLSGGQGVLLPRIRPIGDIDETLFDGETLAETGGGVLLPDAISPIGREFILIGLIEQWASENSQTRLAGEIAASPRQTFNLAASLAELMDGLETEELDWNKIPELYGLESARHREAILDFLSLIRERLPARLHQRQLIGPMARRSLLLRREAQRLAERPTPWPVIAAGSTGSIPATRELLGVIAGLPRGAVVLPGLDIAMDDESWAQLGEQHPQFALKQLLGHLDLERGAVATLARAEPAPRDWLVSEIMRPPATSEAWRGVVASDHGRIAAALRGVELVEARDLREEALVVSLILRHGLETPGKTVSLVTPDRELARRVKQELAQAGITADDSAGEPLIRFGGAALMSLVIDAVLAGFAPDSLMALFRHELCELGFEAEAVRRIVDVCELALFRGQAMAPPLDGLKQALAAARRALDEDGHRHPATLGLAEADWTDAAEFVDRAAACLLPLAAATPGGFSAHFDRLVLASETIAGPALWGGEAGDALRQLVQTLSQDAGYLPACGFEQAAGIVRSHLAATPFRRRAAETRVAILGLLEARLARPGLVVLGGLNEGRWPALPEPGPWLSRPMRAILGMQQPERQIGQTAHDFTQAMGCPEVFLVWSRRVGDAPAIPSRWILRLRMLMDAAGLAAVSNWPALAARLSEPATLTPCRKPRALPPVVARPARLSVTRIETLIRDPYAIYAQHVLRLEPLAAMSEAPDLAARGTIFHGAIGDFLKRFPVTLPADALAQLLDLGHMHFAPFRSDPDIAGFWWPQFTRVAHWLVASEPELRRDVRQIFAEIGGKLVFDVAGRPFTLTCRADRIDVFADGEARILDYKTGTMPSGPQVAAGLAPQLTLQAAMLEAGAFPSIGSRQTRDIVYVKLGGGDPPGDIREPNLDGTPMDFAHRHFDGLKSLLAAYADQAKPYLPRAAVELEDDECDYDHLSRYREWALSGDGA